MRELIAFLLLILLVGCLWMFAMAATTTCTYIIALCKSFKQPRCGKDVAQMRSSRNDATISHAIENLSFDL